MSDRSADQSVNMSSISEANKLVEGLQNYYLRRVAPHVIENGGRYDGKYAAPVSLSTHTINAAFVGLSVFIYDKVVMEGEKPSQEELRVLLSALTLHDVNKFISSRDEINQTDNTREALNKYFETDPYNVSEFLPGDEEEYIDDLLYLIQRTETGEDASETRGIQTEFRGLEIYCQAGDAISSAMTVDGFENGVSRLQRHYLSESESPVQVVNVTAAEQPLLHNEVLGAIKEVIRDKDEPYGLIIGSTQTDILYLGRQADIDEIRSEVTKRVKKRIPENYDFNAKTEWNSVEYGILSDVDIDIEVKRKTIAEQYAEEVLERGSGIDTEVENVPQPVLDVLPELLKLLYIDRDEPEEEQLRDLWNEMYEKHNGQTAKVYFFKELAVNFREYEESARAEAERLSGKFTEDIKPKTSAIETVVGRMFGDDAIEPSVEVVSAKESCFLCGHHTEETYTPGRGALYQARGYSKRVGFMQERKKICAQCRLEYALFEDRCSTFEVGISGDVLVAYFYFDSFIPDVQIRTSLSGSLIDDDTIDFDDQELAIELFNPQVHIQPFSYSSRTSKRNKKIEMVRRILHRLRETGMRAVIAQPLSRVDVDGAVFADTEPVAEQVILDSTTIETYEDMEAILDRLELLKSIGSIGGEDRPYLMLDNTSLHHLIHEASKRLSNPGGFDKLSDHVNNYYSREIMSMQNVAEYGIELYGTQYGSKYKKASVFRVALEATLNGLNNDMTDETLVEFVAGQVYARAERQKWAGNVTHTQAKNFAQSVLEYLDEQELMTLKRLSDWQNALVDTYRFAYEQVVAEQQSNQ